MNASHVALRPALWALIAGLVVALTTAGLAVFVAAPASADERTSRVMSMSSGTYEQKVQKHINKQRAKHGLSRLGFESCTDGTAERWAQRLASSNDFYHQSMTDLLTRCDAFYAGETLGKGSISPHRLVRMWMDSPPHRAVLLSKHAKRIGVGAYVDATGSWVTAANFTKF